MGGLLDIGQAASRLRGVARRGVPTRRATPSFGLSILNASARAAISSALEAHACRLFFGFARTHLLLVCLRYRSITLQGKRYAWSAR